MEIQFINCHREQTARQDGDAATEVAGIGEKKNHWHSNPYVSFFYLSTICWYSPAERTLAGPLSEMSLLKTETKMDCIADSGLIECNTFAKWFGFGCLVVFTSLHESSATTLLCNTKSLYSAVASNKTRHNKQNNKSEWRKKLEKWYAQQHALPDILVSS